MATYGYLAHYGVQGMKWGVRNYQNYDGSYTSAGLSRYGRHSSGRGVSNKTQNKYSKETSKTENKEQTKERKKLSPETKKKIIIGAVAGVTALAVAGVTVAAIKNPEAAKAAVNAIGKTAVKAGQGIGKTATGMKNTIRLNRMAKLNKAVDSGNIVKASKLAKKLPQAMQVEFIEKNAEALGGNLKAANNFRGLLRQTDAGRSLYAKAIGSTNNFNKGKDLVKGATAFNKTLSAIATPITIAGAVTGTVAGGKKILNDINNIYTTESLPVVRDFLNSPRGASTKNFVDSTKNKLFGIKVNELEENKK